MELFKICVENKQLVIFSFFSLLTNIICQKYNFKSSLFIMNQYCMPTVCYTTKMSSKQATGCFLVS